MPWIKWQNNLQQNKYWNTNVTTDNITKFPWTLALMYYNFLSATSLWIAEILLNLFPSASLTVIPLNLCKGFPDRIYYSSIALDDVKGRIEFQGCWSFHQHCNCFYWLSLNLVLVDQNWSSQKFLSDRTHICYSSRRQGFIVRKS